MKRMDLKHIAAVFVSVVLLIFAMPLSGEWNKAFAAVFETIPDSGPVVGVTYEHVDVSPIHVDSQEDIYPPDGDMKMITLQNSYGMFYGFTVAYANDISGLYFIPEDRWTEFNDRLSEGHWSNPTLWGGYYVESAISTYHGVRSCEELRDVPYTAFLSDCTITVHNASIDQFMTFSQNFSRLMVLHYLVGIGEDVPFAVMKTQSKTLDLPEKYTIDWVESSFGVELDVLVSSPKAVYTKANGSGGIEIYIEYSTLPFYTFEANGVQTEVMVGLTPFSLMQEQCGKAIPLTDLNRPNKDYFRLGEYRTEDIYGYFYCAVFDTPIGDLNLYFKDVSVKNAQVYFSHSRLEVNLKEFQENPSKIVVGGVITFISPIFGFGFFFANTVKQIDVYALYIDVFDDPAFIGLNGAEDVNDTTGAFDRWWEEVSESIGNPMKILIAVLGAVLIVIVIVKIIDLAKERERNKPRK